MRLHLSLFVASAIFATPASTQSFIGEWRATAEIPDGTTVSETILVERAADGYTITRATSIRRPRTARAPGPVSIS